MTTDNLTMISIFLQLMTKLYGPNTDGTWDKESEKLTFHSKKPPKSKGNKGPSGGIGNVSLYSTPTHRMSLNDHHQKLMHQKYVRADIDKEFYENATDLDSRHQETQCMEINKKIWIANNSDYDTYWQKGFLVANGLDTPGALWRAAYDNPLMHMHALKKSGHDRILQKPTYSRLSKKTAYKELTQRYTDKVEKTSMIAIHQKQVMKKAFTSWRQYTHPGYKPGKYKKPVFVFGAIQIDGKPKTEEVSHKGVHGRFLAECQEDGINVATHEAGHGNVQLNNGNNLHAEQKLLLALDNALSSTSQLVTHVAIAGCKPACNVCSEILDMAKFKLNSIKVTLSTGNYKTKPRTNIADKNAGRLNIEELFNKSSSSE